MASRRHLIAVTLTVGLCLLMGAGCASSKPRLIESPQEKAVHTARDYIREHGKYSDTDRYVATPYENGWMIRISRQIATNVDGSAVYDPGDTRFVKINADGKVVEYFPGAGID
jgi:hypothetical protein